MSSSPWAQAVNPLQAAVEAMKVSLPGHEMMRTPCRTDGDTGYCDACLNVKIRAALPHLLRATVEGMTDEAAVGIARHIAAADPRPQGMAECADLMRAALLAALTDAAGRLP